MLSQAQNPGLGLSTQQPSLTIDSWCHLLSKRLDLPCHGSGGSTSLQPSQLPLTKCHIYLLLRIALA